ncbi:FkbM family methyltransferase [Enterobacter ludwigii]|nr:FkbM family methyltransferase [Enterobacter ludwigii]
MDDAGETEVKINTIDALVNEKITFMKMDIEGHECSALEGARQHIINDHPSLAICAYHLVDDFWKIPELVLSFRPDYHVYMRHYTEGVLETVFYFVPVH